MPASMSGFAGRTRIWPQVSCFGTGITEVVWGFGIVDTADRSLLISKRRKFSGSFNSDGASCAQDDAQNTNARKNLITFVSLSVTEVH